MPADTRIVLDQLYYVKEFNKQIISVKRLAKQDYMVVFKYSLCEMHFPRGGVLKIINNAEGLSYIRAIAAGALKRVSACESLSKRLQILEENIKSIDSYQIHASGATYMDINDAHDRFGHISTKHVKKTLQGLGIQIK